MDRFIKAVFLVMLCFAWVAWAETIPLYKQPGFIRFSFDNVKMPSNVANMGLLGINYSDDVTSLFYAGLGGYGAVTGSQGGLFVLGINGGLHYEFLPHLRGDLGMFVGGGGGRSATVGGGLMLRPEVGLFYEWQRFRVGTHYSYIDFPSGQIESRQVGLDLDLLMDLYYTIPHWPKGCLSLSDLCLPCNETVTVNRNDFGLILQAFDQKSGATDTDGNVQDGTLGLIGAEFDHYFTNKLFWWIQTAGAFRGVHNGFMDLLAGLGYRWPIGCSGWAVLPQIGVGAGGGGNVNTGGGALIDPSLGLEVPLGRYLAARLDGGYIWAPNGTFSAANLTAEVLYHLDVAQGSHDPSGCCKEMMTWIQNWRVQVLNQTYTAPKRYDNTTPSSMANLIAVQVDQLITPMFFFTYQAASAYQGELTGGLASGLIGPGVQSPEFWGDHVHVFAELLAGAAGGGGLSLAGGSVIEPVLGAHYAFTPRFGAQLGVGQLIALQASLNTTVINLGLTVNFGTANI